MRSTLWMAFVSVCLLGAAVESVIIRDYRVEKSRYSPDSNDDLDQLGAQGSPYPHGRKKGERGRGRKRKVFRATYRSCCKMGYKLAKRQLDCSIRVLDVVRKLADLQRAKMKYTYGAGGGLGGNGGGAVASKSSPITARLSSKIGKCSASYPKYLEKCCKYREQFYRNMEKCQDKPRQEKRKCRRAVRKRYRMNTKNSKDDNKSQNRLGSQDQTDVLDLAGNSSYSNRKTRKQRRQSRRGT